MNRCDDCGCDLARRLLKPFLDGMVCRDAMACVRRQFLRRFKASCDLCGASPIEDCTTADIGIHARAMSAALLEKRQ